MTALDLPDPRATEQQRLMLAHLRDDEPLLVLDISEHVAAAAAALVDTELPAAPGVRVIVTSREPLQVPGAHTLPVPPLALPPPGQARRRLNSGKGGGHGLASSLVIGNQLVVADHAELSPAKD